MLEEYVMKAKRTIVIVAMVLLSMSQVFGADINIGQQPYPNLYINIPSISLNWFEMYINQGTFDIGACFSTLEGDAIDGKHIGLGFSGMQNIWGPYIGFSIGPSIDFSWGKLYDDDNKKYNVFSERIPVSLLVQVLRIDNAAINLYAGGDISISAPSMDVQGDTYESASVFGSFSYGYHFGIQASGKYAGLALGAVAGMQSAKFNESKLEYENIDDGNTYYFKLPAETVTSYFYGIKLAIIPWDISVSYTTQTYKKSDKTGFPEFSQHSFMITFIVGGDHKDVREEKKEEKPKPTVDTL